MKIKIIKGRNRDYFFDSLKGSFGTTWSEIYKRFGIPKSTFEKYRTGEFLIPDDLFQSFLNNLENSIANKINSSLKVYPDNFGQVKGGKRAYKINYEEFAKGRKKGIIKLKSSWRLNNHKMNFDFSNFQLNP